jgi:hypothetical protein
MISATKYQQHQSQKFASSPMVQSTTCAASNQQHTIDQPPKSINIPTSTLSTPQPPLPTNLPHNPNPPQRSHIHRPLVQIPTQPRNPVRVVAGILQDCEEDFGRPESEGGASFVAGQAPAVAPAGDGLHCAGVEAGDQAMSVRESAGFDVVCLVFGSEVIK